jgi:hypothetical protein
MNAMHEPDEAGSSRSLDILPQGVVTFAPDVELTLVSLRLQDHGGINFRSRYIGRAGSHTTYELRTTTYCWQHLANNEIASRFEDKSRPIPILLHKDGFDICMTQGCRAQKLHRNVSKP